MIRALKTSNNLLLFDSNQLIHFFRLYDRNATTILWYYPRFRKNSICSRLSATLHLLPDFKNNEPFRIYFGRDIGKFHHKTIFYSVTKYYGIVWF